MLTKMKKSFAKKLLIILWLIITTVYTVYGIYSYFKYSVYQAGVNNAVIQIVNDVISKDCREATQLSTGNTRIALIDVSCLQQVTPEQEATQ